DDSGTAFEPEHEIAGVGRAGLHAQPARILVARNADQQRVAVRGIELEALRRGGAAVTVRADGSEDVVLNGLEVRGERRRRGTARADRLSVDVQPAPLPAAAASSAARSG